MNGYITLMYLWYSTAFFIRFIGPKTFTISSQRNHNTWTQRKENWEYFNYDGHKVLYVDSVDREEFWDCCVCCFSF